MIIKIDWNALMKYITLSDVKKGYSKKTDSLIKYREWLGFKIVFKRISGTCFDKILNQLNEQKT